MQAQDYGPAKWSIGQRATKLFDHDIDDALETGSIVRTHVMRATWHFVARDDIRWLLALTGPRVQRANASRYRELGLDTRTLLRCEARIVAGLEKSGRLTREEIAKVLDAAKIDRSGQRLPHILMHCELEAIICSGGRRDKKHTYALFDERVPSDDRFDRDEALAELVRRYLASHGPATVKDLRWWSGLTAADIKHALAALDSEVKSETIDQITLWYLRDRARLTRSRGAHLLQTYDELIVGYTESRFFGDPVGTKARTAWRDRQLPTGILLLDGMVGGHWRRTIGKNGVEVEVLTYEKPKRDEVQAIESAGARLGRFLDARATVNITPNLRR
ncbi:MAG: hypothetical protein QOH26_656 [Actinomycetota bacterium]|jgi:hypothetical protein|nr:hypothetical protein [Actinomycetota bacterium]